MLTRYPKTILLLIIFLSPHCKAEVEEFFEIQISDLLEKTVETDDTTYMARASLRCSSLQAQLAILMKENYEPELSQSFAVKSNLLFDFANRLTEASFVIRGKNITTEDLNKKIDNDFSRYAKVYKSWLETNYIKRGEFFGSSPKLQSDVTACNQFANALIEDKEKFGY